MSIVVSDTSPIRALNFLGLLPDLEVLYRTLLIPPAVEQELSHPGSDFPPIEVRNLPIFHIAAPKNRELVDQLVGRLDLAEAEALTLALERAASAVLIDETAGRALAKELGLKTTGTVGVLLEMKQRGIVEQISPLLRRLKEDLDFFLGEQFIAYVIKRAGEDAGN